VKGPEPLYLRATCPSVAQGGSYTGELFVHYRLKILNFLKRDIKVDYRWGIRRTVAGCQFLYVVLVYMRPVQSN
jgi:hypothetical protein